MYTQAGLDLGRCFPIAGLSTLSPVFVLGSDRPLIIKVLRFDLSTGRIWTEDTIERYMEYLGGTRIGYKVMWDKVPPGTRPYDPENRIIFATGPLAGTSAPRSGRTAITTLWPTCWPVPLVASGHMGGHFAAKLKCAGYDAVVIQGKGIRAETCAISEIMCRDAVVAAIGQAGENLVPMSNVMNDVSHSAGGVGSLMGPRTSMP